MFKFQQQETLQQKFERLKENFANWKQKLEQSSPQEKQNIINYVKQSIMQGLLHIDPVK
jgi:hypothetical protein